MPDPDVAQATVLLGAPYVERLRVGARVLVHEEHAVPVLAAVGRAEDAALLLRAGDAPDRARVDDLRVRRVHGDAADVRVRNALGKGDERIEIAEHLVERGRDRVESEQIRTALTARILAAISR